MKMKRMAAVLLSASMVFQLAACNTSSTKSESSTSTASDSALKGIMAQELKSEFQKNVDSKIRTFNDYYTDMYADAVWESDPTLYPTSYDLRDYGTVPEVKSQGNWGTCWGFAAIAASEISIINESGLTLEEFQKKYGQKLDLSEKHLAWFASSYLTEESYISSQDGEGVHITTLNDLYYDTTFQDMKAAQEGSSEDDDSAAAEVSTTEEIQAADEMSTQDSQSAEEDSTQEAEEVEGPTQAEHYNTGGDLGYASTYFSAGIGPVWESTAPYAASDGSSSTAMDWTLPESDRFNYDFELENSSILPSPASHDLDGNYVYNEKGTEAIKDELLEGRGVSIVYYADQAMDPDVQWNMSADQMRLKGCPDDLLERVHKILNGELDMEALEDEDAEALTAFMTMALGDMTYEDYLRVKDEVEADGESGAAEEATTEAAEEDTEMDEATLAAQEKEAEENQRLAADFLGFSYDDFLNYIQMTSEAESEVYMNTENYSQYVDTNYARPNHAVCIVGWDDNYDASNFLEGHRPPANGAWIVRNSWGDKYGNDGYFYLSYYDQTICAPETYDYVLDENADKTTDMEALAYDLMPAQTVDSATMDEATYMANEFTLEGEGILDSISVMTASYDTQVTANVYLLDKDAKSPVDGEMLDSVTEEFEYSGYHRIALNQSYSLEEGAKISVVQVQRVTTTEGEHYAVPYTCGRNMKYDRLIGVLDPAEESTWESAVINPGESFILLDDVWMDWADVVDDFYQSGGSFDYMTYDNLGIKAYLYPTNDIEEIHDFGDSTSYCGVQARICQDCGYVVVEP